jgi:8-oxoguanine deaminase
LSRIWIKNPRASFDGTQANLANGGVVVEGQRIVEVLTTGQQPSRVVDSVFDASGMVLTPGLINTHHHFYQTLTRAYRDALNKPLFAWLTSLYPVWANLTNEMVEVSTELALCELMLSGCTTASDHHYVFSDTLDEAIDRQASVAARLGMRVVLTRGSMSLGQSTGGLPPDKVVQRETVILDDSLRLVKRHHDPEAFAMCQLALAPCSPFSVTPELMRETASMAKQHHVLLHTHLAETHDETQFCIDQLGLRPVDYMESVNWLSNRTWFAHGIHFNSEEITRLGAAGCGVSHCPTSNMTLASGICPAFELEQAGVNVGLGVDGSASNDCSNLIQEVRMSLLIQRLGQSQQDSKTALTSHVDALRWATHGGAALLHRPELGQIAVGAAADLALFSLDEPRFSGSDDALAALILGGAHRAEAVMINGQWRVSHGNIIDVDIEQLQARHQQLAVSLWQVNA